MLIGCNFFVGNLTFQGYGAVGEFMMSPPPPLPEAVLSVSCTLNRMYHL